MTKLNLKHGINVITVNRLMLIVLLSGFLPVSLLSEWLFSNKNISNSIHYYYLMIVIVLLLIFLIPKTIKEFIKDTRFKTLPKWHEILIIIGINYAVTIGLLIFFFGLLDFFLPTIRDISELPGTPNQVPYLPYNQITETFDWLSGSINFIAVVIIVPLYEEFLFRGLALRAYEKARSPLFAAILTAVLFSLFHVNWSQFIFFLPSSFITARAIQVLGSWWIAVIVHMIYNSWIFFLTSFTLTNKTITENPFSLGTGIVGLIIAIVAFCVAMYWFKIRSQETLIVNKKPDKVVTLSLTIFVFICFILMMI